MSVKVGDKVRVKTKEELAAAGIVWIAWFPRYQALIGKEATVLKVKDAGIVELIPGDSGGFSPKEYELVTDTLKRGDIVYVSDESEEHTLSQKIEKVYLTYIEGAKYPYQCADVEEYNSGKPFTVIRYDYAVKKPAEPTKRKLNKKELIAFLEKHGVEME